MPDQNPRHDERQHVRGRDERNSRDWHQRFGEDMQGYRDQERQRDESWYEREPEPDWRAGRFREREQERFGTGGMREYEQDWTDSSGDATARVVERVSGVSEVNNDLRLNRQPGGAPSAEGIRAGRDQQGQLPPATRGGQAAARAGQRTGPAGPPGALPRQQDPQFQGVQASGSRSNRATKAPNS